VFLLHFYFALDTKTETCLDWPRICFLSPIGQDSKSWGQDFAQKAGLFESVFFWKSWRNCAILEKGIFLNIEIMSRANSGEKSAKKFHVTKSRQLKINRKPKSWKKSWPSLLGQILEINSGCFLTQNFLPRLGHFPRLFQDFSSLQDFALLCFFLFFLCLFIFLCFCLCLSLPL
jgi:hypothetical protein